MLRTEILSRDDGAPLERTYSDEGFKIRQNETGVQYDETVDVVPNRYTYTETDEPVAPENITAEEALSIILGGAEL